MIAPAKKFEEIQPSATLTLKAKAATLKKEGKILLDLSVGEPDFPTPPFVKEAAIEAIHANFTKYTTSDGILELKEAISKKFAKENQLAYSPGQIIVSCGAKHSIYNALQAILEQDDEVIIPSPYWVSYPALVQLACAKPVIVNTVNSNNKLTAEQLAAAITEKTKAIIINSPNNPTGAVYTKNELRNLAEVLAQHPNICIISDDIYEHICWQEQGFFNILNACPELYGQTMVINGVSKAYAMTGWRIGYAAGPKKIITNMKKLQSHSTSCPNSIAQKAALAALTGPQDIVKEMTAEFKLRSDYIYNELNKIPGIKCNPCLGAFYSFPNITGLLKERGFKRDTEFTNQLLEKTGVILVPGSAFGAPGFVRLSYATNLNILQEAMKKLHEFR